MITLNREALERGILNQISVLCDGMKFPIYYNAHNYVLLTYKSKAKTPYASIATDARLSILCLEEEKKEEEKPLNHHSISEGINHPYGKVDFRLKVRKEVPQGLTTENYLYINQKVASQYGLKEEKLYRVHVKNSFWRKKEKSYAKFVKFYRKATNAKVPDYPNTKKLEHSFLAYLKFNHSLINEEDEANENVTSYIEIYPSKKLALKLSRQDTVQIDLDESIKDFSTCRVVDVRDSFLMNKLSIVVYVLYNGGMNDGANIRQKVLEEIEEKINDSKAAVLLVSNQLFYLENNICLLKVLERTPEKKSHEIELLELLNNSSKDQINGHSVGSLRRDVNSLDEIVEIRTEVKLEELGFSTKKIEKMLKKYGDAIGYYDHHYEFYQQEFQKALDLLNANEKYNKTTTLLVSGPKKSGKTTFLKNMKRTLTDYYWSFIDFKEFISPEKDIERFSLPLVKKFLEYKFAALSLRHKGIIAFDNVHLLCKHLERIDSMNTHEIIITESLSSLISSKIKTFEKNKLNFYFVFSAEGESFLNERIKKKITDQISLKSLDILEKKSFISNIFGERYIEPSQKSIEDIVENTEYMNLNAFMLLKKKTDSAISFQKGVDYKELNEGVLVGIIKNNIKEISTSNKKTVK